MKAMAQRLLKDKEYRKQFKARLERGDLPPAVETMLYHYAYGKPADNLNVKGDLVLPNIINHFEDDEQPGE